MHTLTAQPYLDLAKNTPVVDVRSPAEFAAGHLPRAHSMPMFSNDERAAVGTAFTCQGHLPAYTLGLHHAGPKMAGFVEQATSLAGQGGAIALYCWRGGMRSGSIGWLLSQAGFQVTLLQGGYKAYRTYVQQQLSRPWPLRVLGGPTGSGKTQVLHALAALGQQVIDLEALAHHKGSAFGGIGQPAQPRIEMFENKLVGCLSSTDENRPIWIEDESQSIGQVFICKNFFELMQAADFYQLETSFETRVTRLVAEYANLPTDELAAAITRIARRMGPQHAKTALQCLAQGNYAEVARIALAYYDKAYSHSQRPAKAVVVMVGNDSAGAASALARYQ